MDYDQDSQGNVKLPRLMRYRTALSPTGIVLRLEYPSAEHYDLATTDSVAQCQMSADDARLIAQRLLTLADHLENGSGMTKQ